jgi:hypothetical protein
MSVLIESTPFGARERETAPVFRPTRRSSADQRLADALAGRLSPVQAARAGRLGSWAPARLRRFRLCLNATPHVFGYALRNVPPELQPITVAGRLTYAAALAWIACRKLWRQDLAFVRLPGRILLGGNPPTRGELDSILEAGPARYRLLQNGEPLDPDAFVVVLNHPLGILAHGDVVIEEIP